MMGVCGGKVVGDHDARSTTAAVWKPEAVRIRLLGGFRVSVGSRTIDEDGWRLRKAVGLVNSTLAIAVLFRPLGGRIQGAIAQGFHRKRYDPAETLEAYAARLRNETDLDALSHELLNAATETLQPEHASPWLRPPERGEAKTADTGPPEEKPRNPSGKKSRNAFRNGLQTIGP